METKFYIEDIIVRYDSPNIWFSIYLHPLKDLEVLYRVIWYPSMLYDKLAWRNKRFDLNSTTPLTDEIHSICLMRYKNYSIPFPTLMEKLDWRRIEYSLSKPSEDVPIDICLSFGTLS